MKQWNIIDIVGDTLIPTAIGKTSPPKPDLSLKLVEVEVYEGMSFPMLSYKAYKYTPK